MQCGSYGNSSWLPARPSLIAQLAREEGTAVQALAGIPTLRLLPNTIFLPFFFYFFKLKKNNNNLSFLRKWKSAEQPHLPLSPLLRLLHPGGSTSLPGGKGPIWGGSCPAATCWGDRGKGAFDNMQQASLC